ncbi:phosphoenolpyruvate--protein phosphotransferase [Gandjariella thermophila]|uniref:Phosphoenolpyruvate-protein phosphotransferase n=1 Tax=Gandjariella thermophila TaxID=1931992 RepID=A0A4D4J9F0_9PSEU|nr:phosphoenolpyruvate--protein phosphotransferase [Gandjariella thermophila]GDY33291.1 phosphoenolpyruvate-protein phosphotransferase [Gandjariella thermophila]
MTSSESSPLTVGTSDDNATGRPVRPGSAPLTGVPVSPGRASGPVVWVADPLGEPPTGPAPEDPAAEAARIRPAADRVAARLRARAERAEGEARAILQTTAAMAEDRSLLGQAERWVTARSWPAARAVHEAAAGFAASLEAAGGYLAERVRDLHDVRDRLVAELLGVAEPGVPALRTPSVLAARDLAPADTAGLDPAKVLALVTAEGGPTSHTAILARALGIPAVVACRGLLDLDRDTVPGLAVDGDTGTVRVLDTPQVLAHRADGKGRAPWRGTLRDGHRVRLLGNVGSAADAEAAVAAGAEGVGLFRTEFCYLAATREPTVAEQRAAYAAVLAPFRGRSVVVRTLDAGADKPLPFLGLDAEPNPALGVRGLRVAFDRPELLDRQLAAIAAAASDTGAEVSVMAPMVATAAEAVWFAERARAAGIPRVGVMIEVPAVALVAAEVMDAVDFVSLGTNDLAQYLFAADRQLGAVAGLNDPWQPALLRLIAAVAEAGAARGVPVGVCGEAAADPLLARALVGLGVTSLSMNATALGGVSAALAEVDRAECRRFARAALAAGTPDQARAAARR